MGKEKSKKMVVKKKIGVAYFLGKLEQLRFPERTINVNGSHREFAYLEDYINEILKMKGELLKQL